MSHHEFWMFIFLFQDIDECLDNTTNDCDNLTTSCVNVPGGFTCDCNYGYIQTETGCIGKILIANRNKKLNVKFEETCLFSLTVPVCLSVGLSLSLPLPLSLSLTLSLYLSLSISLSLTLSLLISILSLRL